jgi:putative mRNA 3-end processing factor
MALLTFSPHSIQCTLAGIHIDPWKPVDRAIITHAHSDHAKWGCKHYLAHKDSAPILRMRLGNDISLQTVEYGEVITLNGVRFSLHPAGHILGSAQVRVENAGETWVASGDYKLEDDGFCKPFESVRCHHFITESTFGLPIYNWAPQQQVFDDIKTWWHQNQLLGKTTILMGYALGKMQRIINGLKPFEGNVLAHGAIYNMNEILRGSGYDLPFIDLVDKDMGKEQFRGALILAPSSALNSAWMKKFEPYSTGFCSGWMAVRGAKNRKSVDRGFVLSDHADWSGLNAAVKNTGAENVYVTHGYTAAFSRWLNEQGIRSTEVKTMYGDEEKEEVPE